MALSKKETSILIEVVFSLVFSFIFLPLFYENQNDNLSSINNLISENYTDNHFFGALFLDCLCGA